MPPTPGDVQTVLYDQATVPMIGVMFGALLTGILLTLGASSIFLLSSKGDKDVLGRNRFLCVYIIILLLAVLAFDAEAFVLGNFFTIFFSQLPKLQEISWIWGEAVGSTTLAITLLADGGFVWRCFMVQRALGPYNSSKWGTTFWAFPACLWVLTLVTGIMTIISPGVHDPASPIHSGVLGTIGIASSSALNVYATIFLTTRLLAHRKLVITCLGDKAPALRHLRIVTILLESAAVNIPITIATAVGLGTGQTFGALIEGIAPPSQALASVIIIHQVALGRAFDQEREDELRIEVASESRSDM